MKNKKWFFIWGGVALFAIWVVADYLQSCIKTEVEECAKSGYIEACAAGDYAQAHAVKAELYASYSKEFGRWRSGEWRDREARQAQEQYRSAVAYIFGQELMAVYLQPDDHRHERLVGLLMAIPVEGAPLAEGVYGSGMFYDNDASTGNTLAIDHVTYQSWVRFYNDRCDQLLDFALVNEDHALAGKVVQLYKPEVVTRFEQDTIKGDCYNIAFVTHNDNRRQQAGARVTP